MIVAQPVLVTAPVAKPLSTDELKAWLRVTHALEDDLIAALQDAAIGHLDGWTGILGRAIMPQTWKEEFDGPGTLRLAMPDVASAAVTAFDDAGSSVTVTSQVLGSDVLGPMVDVETAGAASRVVVQYACGMPARELDAARLLIKLLVGAWYSNRSAVVTGTIVAEMPLAAQAILGQLRWNRL